MGKFSFGLGFLDLESYCVELGLWLCVFVRLWWFISHRWWRDRPVPGAGGAHACTVNTT